MDAPCAGNSTVHAANAGGQRTSALNWDKFAARNEAGLAALAAERPAVAIEAFREAVRLNPVSVEARYNLAMALYSANELPRAVVAIHSALYLEPRLSAAQRLLARTLGKLSRPEEAIETLRGASRLLPNDPLIWNDLGLALTDCKTRNGVEADRLDQAIACCRRAVALEPNLAEAHHNLAHAHATKEEWEEAIASSQRAIALNPSRAETHVNLGNAFRALERRDEAIASYRQAVTLNRNYAEALNNLGGVLSAQGEWDDAIAAFERALSINADYWEAHSNLGITRTMKGMTLGLANELDLALLCHRSAIACRANPAEAHWGLSLHLLLIGRHEEGWREYEHRLAHAERTRSFSKPRWNGARAEEQTILIHSEQGFGDTLHFARYAPLVQPKSAARRIILEAQPQLARLLAQSGWEIEVVPGVETEEAKLPPFDCQVPLMSLPLALGLSHPLPMIAAYVRADAELRRDWRARLGHAEALRIGIAWAGNPKNTGDRQRSMPPEEMAPLLQWPRARFYSLQVGPAAGSARSLEAAGLINLTSHITEFTDTAAFVAELDLIISVDTAIAHLAGAMGRPVWTLLPFLGEWRWGMTGETTPWYPTMRLFRQTSIGDWGGVVRRIARELPVFSASLAQG